MQRRSRDESGNMLIELALSSSLLFLIMFGVIDYSRIFAAACLVRGAARAGTQYGMLSPAHYNDFTGMQNSALADAGSPSGMAATASQFCACSIGGTKVSCPATCSPGTPETYIQMIVSMPYTTMFSYPGVPGTTNLSATSVVRVQ